MAAALQPAETPTPSDTLAAELAAILTGAAIAPITGRAFLRITGPDATRWLNGMVTNNVASLAPGEGNYNFLLSAQGRILGDCTVYRTFFPGDPAFLLSTTVDQAQQIHDHLEKFIIMDDVEVFPFTQQGLLLLGPKAPDTMAKLGLNPVPPMSFKQADSALCEVMVTTSESRLVPQFEVFPPSDELGCLAELQQLAAVPEVSPAALEALRILSGTPRYGVDIRNTDAAHDLPQETAQTQALHFTKGCYLGQEIVERIRSRGSVHRTFLGFVLTGTLPPAGTEIVTGSAFGPEQKKVGELTSVAVIPLPSGPVQLALGYVRREALEIANARGIPFEYAGGFASPAELPFRLAALAPNRP